MKTIWILTLIAILSFPHSFSVGRVASDDDTYTVVIDRADETAAIRDRSIVRTGDVVKFEMVVISSKTVRVEFSSEQPITTHFTFVEMEYNCKTWASRPLRHGALNAVDMSIERSETLNEDWSGRAWRPFTAYACSPEPRAAGQRLRYPDALAFARAASGLREAAIARDRASQDDPPAQERSVLSIYGIDPDDCQTPELRRAAVTDIDKSTITNAGKMSRAMLADALLQRVNEACASLMVLNGGDPFSDPDIIPTRYWYALNHQECKSKWKGTCETTGRFYVPSGYQLCNKTYHKDGSGYEYRVEFTPSDWIEDGASPPKFRAYDYRMYSSGGYRVLNQTSANIKMSNLWITFISDKLDNAQRRKRGCEMPNKPAPPPKPTPPPSALPYVRSNISFPPTSKTENFRMVMATPAGGRSMTRYIVEYFDPNVWNRWMEDSKDTISQGPGDTWEYGPIRFGATCWRFRSEYWTPQGWRPGVSYSQKC